MYTITPVIETYNQTGKTYFASLVWAEYSAIAALYAVNSINGKERPARIIWVIKIK